MAENSKIEWTDHTFNPWVGCQEVSAACDHCYARVMNERWGWVNGWGPHGERKRTSEENWRKPLRWSRAARRSGKRSRVFCASLADVFDNRVPPEWRADLWAMIKETPELDWLMLTKRPENVGGMLPIDWDWASGWPNVWLGTTCEDQVQYRRRWRALQGVPAVARFISYEPALGQIDLQCWAEDEYQMHIYQKPHWVICGGESGSGARDMPQDWARSMRDQCAEHGIAFFMKQMTGRKPIPNDLMVRQFPIVAAMRKEEK